MDALHDTAIWIVQIPILAPILLRLRLAFVISSNKCRLIEATSSALTCVPGLRGAPAWPSPSGLISQIDTTLTTFPLAGYMFMCEEEGTMRRKNTARLLILPLMSLLLVPGRATLTHKTTQRIPVTSSPAGATVSVNGVLYGATPYELGLARKERDRSSGLNPGYLSFLASPSS